MTEKPRGAGARTWCGLVVLLVPALLVAMDISVLFVAAPEITEALRPSSGQWLWAMDIYGFVMAGLLITMGSLGDRFGRKRVLLLGATLFGAASVLLAYAPNVELLIAGRALLAVGGATLAPSTLSLIRSMFEDEQQRRIAIGAWTVAFSGGAVAGPLVGGLLLEHFWWGVVFLINLPVMLVLLVTGPILLPEARRPGGARFDLPGAALSLVAILGLVFAAKQLAGYGPTPSAGVAAAVGVAAGWGFVVRQRRALHPLLDIGLFRFRAFSAAIGANTVVAMATVGLGSLAFTFLQVVHDLTALQAALWALPTFVGTLAGAGLASGLAGRIGPSMLVAIGLLVAAAGFLLIAFGSPQTNLLAFIGGYTVLTFGVGATASSANALVVGAAPPTQAGAASGMAETSTELGGAIGIAVFGSISGLIYRSSVMVEKPGGVEPTTLDTITGALAVAERTDGAQAAALREAALAGYANGVTAAALAGAILTATVAALIVFALRRGDTVSVGAARLGTEDLAAAEGRVGDTTRVRQRRS